MVWHMLFTATLESARGEVAVRDDGSQLANQARLAACGNAEACMARLELPDAACTAQTTQSACTWPDPTKQLTQTSTQTQVPRR